MSFILLNSPDEFFYNKVYAWRILEDMDVPATQSYSWQILNITSQILSYSWRIEEYIYQTLDYSWRILSNIFRVLSYSWNIFTFLSSRPRLIIKPEGRTKIFGGSYHETVSGDVKRHRFWGTK